MDRFDAMQAFARVVETGSFTRAASTLHMSKTTVSQLVQQLEARLRVKLLNRTTRKVAVTADGAAYYERVQALLAALEDADTALSSAAVAPRGRLRVDVPSPFARLLLIPALPGFHERYPDIQLDLGVSDRHVSLLDESVDCVIRGGEITDASLVARHIADLPLEVYAAPAYLAAHGTPKHPAQLQAGEHRVVGYRGARKGQTLVFSLQREGESLQVQGRSSLVVDDGNAYLAAGQAGLGVLWLPRYMALGALANGELVRLFEDWEIAPMPLYIAYTPNRHVSGKLRVFMEWVVEVVRRGCS
ncbi:LysR substrate-binding domain-containing protein [Pseudomonas sp. 148P]|uniref:LysR substrate-binding domain-containing protein n=1 Tax=Pseudomonas ulcerans TaxID=3115852 RepID=A0ABU7HX10_9PSED|nr:MULTISPECIES: LysR substrate-binding domain-containing protein [unclassified Pseudomonas]MEE1924600.1 LysR substrate-binding domain-containing protein [Pseudomonas sp. 147P]MEE1936014.1 LysR substrate-binding domain-containing protein [Pseudomonas sp. 148P]